MVGILIASALARAVCLFVQNFPPYFASPTLSRNVRTNVMSSSCDLGLILVYSELLLFRQNFNGGTQEILVSNAQSPRGMSGSIFSVDASPI